MTPELLEKSNALIDKINDLKNHYKSIKTENENPYESGAAKILVENNFETRMKQLSQEFLPFTLPEFMELYLSRVEKEIKKLEKQFEKL